MVEQPDRDAQKEKRSLGEYFEKVWGQALLAVSQAEDDARTAAQRVAQAYGLGQDELRRQTRLFTERLIQQRRELERSVEESVQRGLGRMKVPRREALEEIADRLHQIESRIAALEDEGKP